MKKAENEVKIIGITGSKGKSTTAYLVHEYLKRMKKRSVLYSSIKIDSPKSNINSQESVENPILNEQMIDKAIKEAKEYEAEYLILEVNERAIKQNRTKNIKFKVKAITNIIPKHNEIFYEQEEYVKLKQSFLENSQESINVFGLTTGIEKDDFLKMKEKSAGKTITYASQYVIKTRQLKEEEIDLVLKPSTEEFENIKGLNFKIEGKKINCEIKTSIIMNYNALNILCVVGILQAVKEFKEEPFKKFIKEITIPGRDEKIEYKNRTIIISPNLAPQLEELKKYQKGNEKLIVVAGTSGTNFKTWQKEFSDEKIKEEKETSIKWAYNYIKNYANYVIITENDNANSKVKEITEKQKKMLDENTHCEIQTNRKKAIKKAIKISNEGDILFIAGRGNRKIFFKSKNTVKLFKDQEEIKKIIKESK